MDKTIAYGDVVPAYTVSYSGFVGTDTYESLGGTLEFTCGYSQYDDADTYTITPSGYTSSNYAITFEPGTLTVSPKEITVTIAAKSSIYGDAIEELTADDNGGIVNGDADVYSLSTTAGVTSAVGTYDVTGTTLDDNYSITFENGTNAYTITARELTVTVVVSDKAYDGTNTASITSAALNNIANSDEVSLVNGTATFASEDVGADIAISFTDFSLSGDAAVLVNYTLTQPTGVTASITAAAVAATDFTVTQEDGGATVTLGTDEAVDINFTGSAIEPTVAVAGDSLVTADDYKVAYGTNTAVGDDSGTVTITGKGNFTGTLVYTFNIIDQEAPTGTITIGTNAWNKFWNTVTFGLFFNKTQTVTVEVSDNNGVAKTEYYLAGEAVDSTDDLADVTWTAFFGSFDIDPEKTCVVYVKITDNSGNTTIINSDGIVLETTVPVFVGIADGETYCDSVTFTVTEANLSEVTVDGDALTANEDGSYTITADGQTHAVVATDKAGNSASASVTVNTDHTWEYTTDGTTITETCKYCGETASVTISAPEGEQTYDGGSHDAGLSYSGTLSGGNSLEISYTLDGDSVDRTTAAGTYVASVTCGGKTVSVTYTVAKAEVTITAADASKTYGDDDPELTGTVKGVLDADMDSLGVTYSREAGENVGTYIITPSYTENSNYDITIQTAEFSIGKRAVTVTANANLIIYGDEPSANGVTYDGFVNGEDENVLTGELKYSFTYEQYGDVGTYSITPSGLSSENYEITYADGTLTVGQKEVELLWTTLDASDLVYNGIAKTLTASVTNKATEDDNVSVDAEVSGDNVNVTEKGFYYTAVSLSGDDSGNYCLPLAAACATYIITAAALTDVSVAQTGTLTYNGTAQTAEVTASAATVDGTDDDVTFTYSASEDGPYTAEVPAFTNAGTYTVYYRAEAANHATESGSFTVTIAKAVYDMSGVCFADATYTYDGTEKTLTITGTLPDGVTVSYENNTLTDAGSTTATATFTGDADNYEAIASKTATLTIINADFTVTVTGYEGVYDGEAHGITVTADEGVTMAYSISEADNKDYSETNPTFTDAGTYTVYYKAGKSNYNDVTGSATVVITQAEGEGIVNITGWTYGEYDAEANSPVPVSATNGTDNVTYLYKAQGADDDTYTDEVLIDAGSYTVQATFAETNNYKAVTATADFTIAKATYDMSAVSFEDAAYTYDGTEKMLTITGSENLPEGVAVSYTDNTLTEAGSIVATATFTGDSDNYEAIEPMTATLIITAAEMKDVSAAQDGTLTYDGTAQTAEVTASATTADGTDEDVTFTYSASEDGPYTEEVPEFNNAGSYTVYYRAEAANHTAASGSFTVTINAKSVTASISGTTEKTYDGTADTTAEQELSIELNGVVDGDDVTATAESYTYDSAAVDSAGTITAAGITLGGDDAGNYELTATTATIEGSITAKEITVSITPNGGTYAGTITAATATLDGVIDADADSVDVILTYTGTANDGTEYESTTAPTLAGTYTVTATISDSNYSLSGTTAAEFVIAKATYDMSGVSFADTTYRYDGTEKTLTISGTLPDGVTVSYENNTLTDAGSTVATATFTGDSDNYEVLEQMTATLTVAVLTDLPEQDFPDEGAEHKVEVQEGLTEVPEALQDNPELDTVEEIETQLKALVVGQIGYTEENTIIYDVTLMISFDGGLTWEKATAENFPEGGLTVILPYPEGTNKEEYDFTVIHMFTTSAFGKTPGDTEILDPVKTDDGLQVTLTGLSPIIVAWKAIAQSSGSGSSGGTQTESETETETEVQTETGSETESESEVQTETETQMETETQTETEAATETEIQTETETETETTAQTETETESETTAQSDTESETTVQSESETETETENSVQTGDDTPLGLWLTLFLMSAAVLLMTGERKRRRN